MAGGERAALDRVFDRPSLRRLWALATAKLERYAAVRGSNKASPATASEVTSYVQDRTDGIPDADMTINVTWSPNNNPGGSVTVLVTYNYEYIIGSMLGFDPVDLQGRSTMIVN